MNSLICLIWGVTPFVVPFDLINPENTIEAALKMLVEQDRLHKGTTVVIIGSIMSIPTKDVAPFSKNL